jgi:hypothetical protein
MAAPVKSSPVIIAALGELLVEFVCAHKDTAHARPAPYVGPFASGAPGIFIDQAAQITGRAKSNLSRTLKAMAGYGLVRMEKGKGLKLVPKVIHDRVELVLPLIERRKSKGTRK